MMLVCSSSFVSRYEVEHGYTVVVISVVAVYDFEAAARMRLTECGNGPLSDFPA